ncbi:MAG TPA: hypothetical protein VM577_09270 [Anaerovoracaceae bacterium]|nr:hypothetical protein [Anaerovoracaceae bacterium]
MKKTSKAEKEEILRFDHLCEEGARLEVLLETLLVSKLGRDTKMKLSASLLNWFDKFGAINADEFHKNVLLLIECYQSKLVPFASYLFPSLLCGPHDVIVSGVLISIQDYELILNSVGFGAEEFHDVLRVQAMKDNEERFNIAFKHFVVLPEKAVSDVADSLIALLVGDEKTSHFKYIIKLIDYAPDVLSRKKQFFKWPTRLKKPMMTPSLKDLLAHLDVIDEKNKLEAIVMPVEEQPKKRASPF